MSDLENLSAAQRIALAERLGKKGEALGHELARDGHPIVLTLNNVSFSHAGTSYKAGHYAPETLSEMDSLANREAAAELGEDPPTSRTRGLWWILSISTALNVFVLDSTDLEQEDLPIAVVLVGWVVLNLALLIFLSVFGSALSDSHKQQVATYKWRKQVILEPILAGMRIALREYERERYADQQRARIEEMKRQEVASMPYYPEAETEPKMVSITEPRHQNLWNPPPTHFDSLPAMTRKDGGRQSLTYKQAESDCANWLRLRGEPSARVTPDGADGGVDITSNRFVCQVKNYKGSVGVPAVRDLYGISVAEGKKPLFFTTGKYTKAAIEFADRVGMPLIVFDSRVRKATASNDSAEALLSRRKI